VQDQNPTVQKEAREKAGQAKGKESTHFQKNIEQS
jgi:hypothetical protein